MHEIQKVSVRGAFDDTPHFVLTPGRRVEFIKLPSGDFIRPVNVEAIRVQLDKADRRTGEVAAKVHIDHGGSWFSVGFASAADAQEWADRFADLCNRIRRGERMGDAGDGGLLSRAAAQGFIADLGPRDAGPDDLDASDDETDA